MIHTKIHIIIARMSAHSVCPNLCLYPFPHAIIIDLSLSHPLALQYNDLISAQSSPSTSLFELRIKCSPYPIAASAWQSHGWSTKDYLFIFFKTLRTPICIYLSDNSPDKFVGKQKPFLKEALKLIYFSSDFQ